MIFFGSPACAEARNGEKDLNITRKDSVAQTVAALNVRRDREPKE